MKRNSLQEILATGSLLLGGACLMLSGAGASADIVTYDNGKIIKGIVRDLPNDPDAVQFLGSRGTMRILRTRIQNVEKEAQAKGYIHIATEHRAAGKFPEAIAALNQALKEDPANAEVKGLMDQIQSDIDAKNKMSRDEALKHVDDL